MYTALKFLETTKERRNVEAPLPGEGIEQRQQSDFLAAYEDAKSTLLGTAAARKADIMSIDPILDSLSDMRRIIDQMAKAEKMLQTRSVEGLVLEEGAESEGKPAAPSEQSEPEHNAPSSMPAPIPVDSHEYPTPGSGRLKTDDPM